MDKRRRVIFGGRCERCTWLLKKMRCLSQRRQSPDPRLGQKLLQGTPEGGWPKSSSAQESPAPFELCDLTMSQTLHSMNMNSLGELLWALPVGLQGTDLPSSFPRWLLRTETFCQGEIFGWIQPKLPLNCPWTALQVALPLSRDTSQGLRLIT